MMSSNFTWPAPELAEFGKVLDRAGIGCPGRQDRSLFVQGQIGVPTTSMWMRESAGWVQQCIDIHCATCSCLDMISLHVCERDGSSKRQNRPDTSLFSGGVE